MDRVIYLTMAGAKAALQRQEAVANNLANAATTGFRATLTAFRAVPVQGDSASTRVYALESTTGYSDKPGPVLTTGRSLDVAMKGNAWLAVQGPDGTEAYTRNGGLHADDQGVLRLSNGLAVLGDGGPITVPENAEVQVAGDGSITARVGKGVPTPVGRLKLVTPETPLERGDDALFRNPGGDLPADANARVQDGALEGSNVSIVESMVAMIAAARQFEHQMQMAQTAKEREQSAGRLLSTTG